MYTGHAQSMSDLGGFRPKSGTFSVCTVRHVFLSRKSQKKISYSGDGRGHQAATGCPSAALQCLHWAAARTGTFRGCLSMQMNVKLIWVAANFSEIVKVERHAALITAATGAFAGMLPLAGTSPPAGLCRSPSHPSSAQWKPPRCTHSQGLLILTCSFCMWF